MKTKARKRTMQRAAETFTLHQMYLKLSQRPILKVSMEQNVMAVEAFVPMDQHVPMDVIKDQLAYQFAQKIVESDIMKIEVSDDGCGYYGYNRTMRGSIRVVVPRCY